MSPECTEILRNEFDAGDGSFLIQIRGELSWNKDAFTRLIDSMEACCAALEGSTTVDRSLAAGFWYMSWYVRSWTTHESFPRDYPDEYYEQAYELLADLAFWFFEGTHPYLDRRLRLPV